MSKQRWFSPWRNKCQIYFVGCKLYDVETTPLTHHVDTPFLFSRFPLLSLRIRLCASNGLQLALLEIYLVTVEECQSNGLNSSVESSPTCYFFDEERGDPGVAYFPNHGWTINEPSVLRLHELHFKRTLFNSASWNRSDDINATMPNIDLLVLLVEKFLQGLLLTVGMESPCFKRL